MIISKTAVMKTFLQKSIISMEECPIEAFSNQVGGHTFELQNQGMLHQGSCILKQLQDMGRGYEESMIALLVGIKKLLFTKLFNHTILSSQNGLQAIMESRK